MNLIILDTINHQELKIIEWLRQHKFTNYFHDFTNRGDSIRRLAGGIMGWHWEDEFKAMCELHGFKCEKPALGERYDLVVNNKRVQCKFTMMSKTRIDLRKNGHNEKYKPGDFDIMALNISMDIYIVPIPVLLNKDLTETKSSVTINQIQPYKDNYEVFNEQL